MQVPLISAKPTWFILILALCAGQVSAQTGAFTELDENGWSVFTLRANGRIYYVSNSGSDANNGRSPETPFKTIRWGMTRMSGGDWLLLKRGDVFNQALDGPLKNGPSAQHKTVFGAYGDPSEPRPIIDPPGAQAMFYHSGATNGQPIVNLALVSLHMYQSERDPSSPNYNPGEAAAIAIQFFPNGEELLFEDLRIEFFTCGISLQGDVNRSEGGYRNIRNVTLRRCSILNHYSAIVGVHSSGIFFDYVFNCLIEENLFDHNGHYPNITDAVPTIFNHNMYIQSTSGPDTMVRHNIIARASSHGIQLRPGGIIEENVFIHNGIAGFVAGNNITAPASQAMALNNNVILEAATWGLRDDAGGFGVRAWGVLLEGTNQIPDVLEMKDNIVANGGSQARSAYQVDGRLQSVAVTTGNITYNWGSSSNTSGTFPNPGRTSGSYHESIGGTGTMSAYLAAAGEQRKGNWNMNYTWGPLHRYINEGFGRTGGAVNATGMSVSPESVSIPAGQTEQLVATVSPGDAAETTAVLWSSDNPSVATVGASSGIVTAVAEGTASITATTVDASFMDTCIVTVISSTPLNFWSLIGASLEDAETGAYFSTWFGYFNEQEGWNGWIQHEGLAWLYTGVATGENVWVWSPHIQSWIYTTENHFPWVWVREDAASAWTDTNGSGWMYYAQPDSSEPGLLYSYAREEWISL